MKKSSWKAFITELETATELNGKIVFCGVILNKDDVNYDIVYNGVQDIKANRKLKEVKSTKIQFIDLEKQEELEKENKGIEAITNLDRIGKVYEKKYDYVAIDGKSSTFFVISQGGLDLIYYVEWSDKWKNYF